MAAQSDNKYDVYNWISQVIDSCTTVSQVHNAERLVERFKRQTQDLGLHRLLWPQIYNKIDQILKADAK